MMGLLLGDPLAYDDATYGGLAINFGDLGSPVRVQCAEELSPILLKILFEGCLLLRLKSHNHSVARLSSPAWVYKNHVTWFIGWLAAWVAHALAFNMKAESVRPVANGAWKPSLGISGAKPVHYVRPVACLH